MRVLMIAPTPFFADRGCHVHILEQALALKRQGVTVQIATYGSGRNIPGVNIIRTLKFPLYNPLKIGPSWHKLYADPCLLMTAFKAAITFRPDIIHGHLHEGAFIGWVVSRLLDIPLVFDCQGSLTGELIAHRFPAARTALMQTIWRTFEKWIDSKADAVLAQSSNMRSELIKLFHVPESKITMAYDGVNSHTFAPGRKDPELLRQLRIPHSSPVVVFLGVLTPYQGIHDLLAAFPKVLQKVPEAHLLILGYPHISRYQKMSEELGIAQAVHFPGRIRYEDTPRYLALGDVAVTPKRSQTEANGKVYNYMAAGLPVVAFDTVVNRDILGSLGAYVTQIGDVQGLALQITRLLQKPEARQRLSELVRERAVSRYAWEDVAQRIRETYRRVLRPWQMRVFNVSIRKQAKWRWLSSNLPALSPTNPCLDIGCGIGTLSYLLEQQGGRWHFTEQDPEAARQAQAVLEGAVSQTPLPHNSPPKSYHLITLLDVLEHVPNPGVFLKEVAQSMLPHTRLLLTTPADDGRRYFWRTAARLFFGIDNAAHGHVVTGFSRPQLQQLLDQAGLVLEQSQQFSFFFTEMIELIYNGLYVLKNRGRKSTSGYNLALSPASTQDFSRHHLAYLSLRLTYPLLAAVANLDALFPWRRGYEWGVVARKKFTT